MPGELKCKCGNPARYTRGHRRKQVGYCREHPPSEVVVFQYLALGAMQRGHDRRITTRGQR